MNPLKWIWSGLRWLWKRRDEIMKRVKQYTDAILPIVEMLAKLTPTLADDELIALYKRHGIPNVERYLALPIAERGEALRRAAVFLAAQKFPDAKLHELYAAIELAVLQAKNPVEE